MPAGTSSSRSRPSRSAKGHCLETDIPEIAAALSAEANAFSGATVLLCGGHGFLGRYFISLFRFLNERVLPKPCRLIVLDNHITSGALGDVEAEGERGYRYLRHDVIRPLTIDEPLDYVIHAAGIASPYYYRKYPLETLEVATIGTKNLLALGRSHPLKGFLFFSSSEVYGDPDPRFVPTPETYRGNVSALGPRACYDESKRLGETLCMIFQQLHGVPTRTVRPFNVYGPGMQEADYRVLPNFAGRILKGEPLNIYGDGTQTRTFCYVTDAMIGFTKALVRGRSGEVYNIGNPSPEVSMLDLAKAMEQTLGRALEIRLVDHPSSYPADEPQRRCPDIRKAAAELGYQPAVPLPEGLARFFAWAQRHYTSAATPPTPRRSRRSVASSST
ncbi:MAG: NAD-dependent epimerase/dehydratase family protein [Candidatus Omnitrophica bacterium]|nr:NAD-dependent epimerase/dehydratase family protein [Candidatus Omnitrophota bacterium]